nr:XRE family transcriptional regulator [Nonomuraea sp. FMUSA5-5]
MEARVSDRSFGQQLRVLRQSAGLTIEALAEASTVSGRAISDMERGRARAPQERTLVALADALELGDAARAELVELARAERSGNRVGRPKLYELPRGLGDFVGRVPELELLVRRGREASGEGPAPVVVVHGQAGVGKTACAVRAAEQLREVFPDGQFYVDLRGTDAEPMPTVEVLDRLLRALGVKPGAIAEDEQERASQVRALLAERRCLLVLDNAADEAQVRPVLPGPGAGMAIVTSRRTLAGLDAVSRIALAPLSPLESAELLRMIVRDGSARAQGGEVVEVARLCGHLPLALRIAGTRLASRPGWTMKNLAERLSDEDRRLAQLSVGDVGVEAAFALSYAVLSSRAKTLFRRLAHVPSVDFAAPIAAVLTRTDLFTAEDELDRLVELGLLQHEGADRYRFHDLIRLYATQRLRDEETLEVRAAAEQAMADWLLETATMAGRWFEPEAGEPPAEGKGLVAIASPEEAHAWLQVERDSWLAALRLAAAAGRHEQVAGLGEAIYWFAGTMDHWSSQWVEVFALSRAAAARLPDRLAELRHLNYYAWAVLGVGRLEESAALAMEAYRLAESLGAVKEQAEAIWSAGEVWRVASNLDQALWAYSRARELADTAGAHITFLQSFVGAGLTLAGLGRVDEALREFRAVLRQIDGRPVPPGMAQATRAAVQLGLARTLADAQRWQEAIDEATPALAASTEMGRRWYVGHVHLVLGRAHAALGAAEQAREHLTAGIELLQDDVVTSPRTMDEAKAQLAALGD